MRHFSRRQGLALLSSLAFAPSLARATDMTAINAYRFSFPALKGGDIKLADFKGKPIRFINGQRSSSHRKRLAGISINT